MTFHCGPTRSRWPAPGLNAVGQFLRLGLNGIALWLLVFAAGSVFAQQVVPPLSGHVVDVSATLSPAEHDSLEAKLRDFESQRGAQIVVLLVGSTQPEDIVSYANRVGNTWKIGRKDIGDGLLLVAAMQDHKLRIEVAKTLEGAIPDLEAKRIIDGLITPRFKQGDYAGGLDAGVGRIMALITGEALPAPNRSSTKPSKQFDWMQLAIFMFIAVPVVGAVTKGVLGQRLGSMVTGGVAGAIAFVVTSSALIAGLAALVALVLTLVQSTSIGRGRSLTGNHSGWGAAGRFGSSGGGQDNSFGGGFHSGGGGDFGGGGASGGW